MDCEGMFACQKCTYLNPADKTRCDVCSLPRGASPKGAWQCDGCGACCSRDETSCGHCGRARARTPSERTRLCRWDSGAENFLSDIKCSVKLPERDRLWRCVSCDASRDSDDVLSVFSCPDCRDSKSLGLVSPEPQWTPVPDKVLRQGHEISNEEEMDMIDETADSIAHNVLLLKIDEKALDVAPGLKPDVNKQRRPMEQIHAPSQKIDEAWRDHTRIRFPDAECRLVLLGKTGSGKSATANTIAGFRRFETGRGFRSTTRHCQRVNQLRFGVHVEVVDTPGLFDTDLDNATVAKEIIKCIGVVSPGPHALVLVLRIGSKFTEEEIKALEIIRAIFGKELLKYLVLVFTNGDKLRDPEDHPLREKDEIESMLEKAPSKLKELVKEANNRYVVFNNKGTPQQKEQHVKELLLCVRQVVQFNGCRPFTNSFLEIAEEVIQERETTLALNLPEILPPRKGNHRKSSRSSEKRRLTRDLVREELVQTQVKECQVLTCIKKLLQPAIKVLSGNAGPVPGKGCCIM